MSIALVIISLCLASFQITLFFHRKACRRTHPCSIWTDLSRATVCVCVCVSDRLASRRYTPPQCTVKLTWSVYCCSNSSILSTSTTRTR